MLTKLQARHDETTRPTVDIQIEGNSHRLWRHCDLMPQNLKTPYWRRAAASTETARTTTKNKNRERSTDMRLILDRTEKGLLFVSNERNFECGNWRLFVSTFDAIELASKSAVGGGTPKGEFQGAKCDCVTDRGALNDNNLK